MNKPVAIVTGASAGIGKEVVLAFLKQGYVVHAVARRREAMKTLEAQGAQLHTVDLKQPEAIAVFVKDVLARDGRVDVLVNNAGYGSYGALEEVPMQDARDQMEVNLFAPAQLIQAIVPTMRQQRSGKIINVSSIGGKLWSPMGAWYHASKFALEGLSDSLRNELRPFGIDVVVIEPGGVKTEWGTIAVTNLMKTSGQGPYKAIADAFAKLASGADKRAAEPSQIATVIMHAVTVARPRARYVAPLSGRIMLRLRWLLSDRVFDALCGKVFKIPQTL